MTTTELEGHLSALQHALRDARAALHHLEGDSSRAGIRASIALGHIEDAEVLCRHITTAVVRLLENNKEEGV